MLRLVMAIPFIRYVYVKLKKLNCMSSCIVRIEGDLIKHPASLKNLSEFLQHQPDARFLVVSTLPDIETLIGQAIEQVFHSEGLPERVISRLTAIWQDSFAGAPSSDYRAESEKLASLLKGIFLTGDYSPALGDFLKSQGEILSAHLVKEAFQQDGTYTEVLLPGAIGLEATLDYGNATFTRVSREFPGNLTTGTIWIIPGSFGITEGGRIARAGASAADYTAAFLVAETRSDRLILWGTARDFYAADRSVVPDARILDRLTYAEASELAYFDHFSLHPRAVEPLVSRHIPIHVVNPESSLAEPVTIINTESFVAPGVVKSVACTDDISILKLNGPGVGLKPGILARITGKLAEASVNIKSVITSQVSINILLDSKSGKLAARVAKDLGFTAVNEIELLEEVSLIAIVGHGMQSSYGISAKLFGAVAQNQINVILSGSGASDLVSYLLVHSSDRSKSVRAIYDAFLKP